MQKKKRVSFVQKAKFKFLFVLLKVACYIVSMHNVFGWHVSRFKRSDEMQALCGGAIPKRRRATHL